MVSNTVAIMKEGERKLALTPRSRETVESEQVTSTYTEEHTPPAAGGGKGQAPADQGVTGEE